MYIIRPLFTTPGQIIVCLVFVLYTVFAIYGATQMRDGMDFGQLLSDTSYAKAYFQSLGAEYDIYPLVQLIITEPIPYWRTDYLRRIEELVKNLKKLDGETSKSTSRVKREKMTDRSFRNESGDGDLLAGDDRLQRLRTSIR